MGILAPLFLLGLGGLALPLVLHLIRRTPRGRQQFSSLMFLSPTPPQLTRRSRLDQVLLLLMRLAALALLAFAFARPFLRGSSLLSFHDLPKRRVALVMDTSGSMQRAGLWRQAVSAAEKELAGLAPHDEVALFTFADRVQTVVSFPASDQATSIAPAEVVRKALADLKPSWAAGDLGSALVTIAGDLAAASDVKQSLAEAQLIVVSDFQRGNRVEALQGFDWPPAVKVVPRTIEPQRPSNAALQLLTSDDSADSEEEPRVRVSNAANSTVDQFFVRWHNSQDAKSGGEEVAVYVPPGQSRVLSLPRPRGNLMADRIVLRGDDQDYDNTFYVVPPRQQQVTLAYVGDDQPNDPQGSLYYLQLATSSDPLRQVEVKQVAGETATLPGPPAPHLVVVTKPVTSPLADALARFAEEGGSLLLAPSSTEAAQSIASLIREAEFQANNPSARDSDFQLLGTIDFQDPLFLPFANPRYNDFTRIHFWQHRTWKLAANDSVTVLARFDNGDPWLVLQPRGKGRIWLMTSGWHPQDSQLAVSSKFVPLVGNLLDAACGSARTLAPSVVNAPVTLPAGRTAPLRFTLPSGAKESVAADVRQFQHTSLPGIYVAPHGQDELRFAVNLSPSESDTLPLPLEQLEQLGLKLGTSVSAAEQLTLTRQRRDVELESRQKLWQWLIVGCLGLIILETWWAGLASRPARPASEGVA
jgi:hypothetical protein